MPEIEATPFKYFGLGNGLPYCIQDVEVSDYPDTNITFMTLEEAFELSYNIRQVNLNKPIPLRGGFSPNLGEAELPVANDFVSWGTKYQEWLDAEVKPSWLCNSVARSGETSVYEFFAGTGPFGIGFDYYELQAGVYVGGASIVRFTDVEAPQQYSLDGELVSIYAGENSNSSLGDAYISVRAMDNFVFGGQHTFNVTVGSLTLYGESINFGVGQGTNPNPFPPPNGFDVEVSSLDFYTYP